MCSSLRFLVVTLFLLGLSACAEKPSVKSESGETKVEIPPIIEDVSTPPLPEKSLCERVAKSEGPPPNGFLRINTEMHTAPIKRIAVDAQGQYLVTGSDDKTARVWSLPDGKLLRVLRPPIGEGTAKRWRWGDSWLNQEKVNLSTSLTALPANYNTA